MCSKTKSRTGEGVSCPCPPTSPTVYLPYMVNSRIMRESTMPSAQMNSVTKNYAMNMTTMWLGRTGNGVSCLSPSSLSIKFLSHKITISVHRNSNYVSVSVGKFSFYYFQRKINMNILLNLSQNIFGLPFYTGICSLTYKCFQR